MQLQNDARMKDVKIQELTCNLQKTEGECIDLKTKMKYNMWKEKSQSHYQQDTEELKTLLDTLEKMQSICTQALSRKQGTTQENIADEPCFLKPLDPGPEHMAEAIAVNQDDEEISVDQMSFKSEVMEDDWIPMMNKQYKNWKYIHSHFNANHLKSTQYFKSNANTGGMFYAYLVW